MHSCLVRTGSRPVGGPHQKTVTRVPSPSKLEENQRHPRMTNSVALSTALRLAELGIRVFPMPWRSKSPYAGDPWKATSSNDPATITARLNRCSDLHNLSIVVGPESGILDIELDSQEAARTWDSLQSCYGPVQTIAYGSRRGVHRLFRWSPAVFEAGGRIAKLVLMDMECRLGGDDKGAYSVVPPSLHPDDGIHYRWLPGCSPWEVSIAPLPTWLENLLIRLASEYAARSPSRRVQYLAETDEGDFLPTEGHRHDYALHLSQHLFCRMRLPRQLVTNIVKAVYRITGKIGSEFDRDAEILVNGLQRPPRDEDALAEIDWMDADQAAVQLVRAMKAEKQMREGRPPCPPVFPELLEKIGDLSRDCQIPRNFVMLNQLVAVASAVGSAATIQYSEDAPNTGLQIYGMGCGDSGVGKSLSLRGPLAPLSDSRALCTDATPESLMAYLGRHPRGVLLRMAEGKQFSAMLGRYRGNSGETSGGSNNSLFCEAWSGDPIVAIRQDEKKSIRVERPYLCIAAVIQPYNLRTFSVDDVMDGLLQRVLMVSADPVPEEAIHGAAAANSLLQPEYHAMIQRLRTLRPHVYDPAVEQQCSAGYERILNCQPLALVLDREAEAEWKAYQKWKRSPVLQDFWPEGHPFRADLHRHAEIVLRVAGCMYLAAHAIAEDLWNRQNFNQILSQWVPVWYVRQAIQFVEWCWEEKKAIAEQIVEEKYLKAVPSGIGSRLAGIPEMMRRLAVQRSRKLLPRINGAETWTQRDYYRHLRLSADEAAAELTAFVQHGLVQPAPGTQPQKYQFVQQQLFPPGRR